MYKECVCRNEQFIICVRIIRMCKGIKKTSFYSVDRSINLLHITKKVKANCFTRVVIKENHFNADKKYVDYNLNALSI